MTGIIFDLDGVLVHTDEYHYLAWKKLADRLNTYFDRTINQRLRGVSRMESLEILLERYQGPGLTQEEKEQLAGEKNECYRQFLRQMNPESVDPQVRSTLQELRNRGYRLAVGSSSKNAKMILELTDLNRYFDAVSDGTNIVYSKPDPEVFLKAAEFLGIEPGMCAVVEDAASGIEAAKAAGMFAVGIGDAANCGDAHRSIGEFRDLLQIFNKR